MIQYFKIFEDDEIVRYTYKPWGKGPGGIVEFNKKKDDITKVENAEDDKLGRYMIHMVSEIENMNKQKIFKKQGKVIWA